MKNEYQHIGEKLDQIVKENENKVFMYYKDTKYTYKKFNEKVNQFANLYNSYGVKKGEKFALLVPNNDICAINLISLMKIGAVVIPINYNKIGEGLKFIINHCDAKYLLLDKRFLENFKAIEKELTKLSTIFLNGIDKVEFSNSNKNYITIDRELKKQSVTMDFEYPEILPNDDLQIIYTSGTTGPPKGVLWSHNMLDLSPSKFIGFSKNDRMYTCLPLFHGLAQRMLFMCLLEGATFILREKFSASQFWNDIRKYNANWFCYIGVMLHILLKQSKRNSDKDNPIRYCYGCGAPTDPERWKEFEKRFNVEIIEYYGATEGGTVTIGTKPGSIGKVKPNFKICIIDENGVQCPPHKVGELLYRNVNSEHSFKGYYKNEAATKEKLIDGWIRSGDLVYQDNEGYLYFVGRKIESMRRRGENISPWEIESIINKHPLVKECAAVPVPSEFEDDEIKLCVVLKEGAKLTFSDLIKYCKEHLASYLVPRYLEFYKKLPKTPTEKIEREKLKNEGITNNTWHIEKIKP